MTINIAHLADDGTIEVVLIKRDSSTYLCRIDAADYQTIQPYHWQVVKAGKSGYTHYAMTVVHKNGKWTTLYMHALLTGAKKTDHRDGDGLNNVRNNLRAASSTQNGQNRNRSATNKAGYKGVCWHKKDQRWRAYITVNGKQLHLGNFADKVQAAHVYDTAARQYFGEFARTNFNNGVQQ